MFLGNTLVRGEIWQGDILVADIEDLETMDATETTRKFSTQRKSYFPKKMDFSVADGRIRPLGGDQDLRTRTLVRQRPIQGESNIDFLGEPEGSLPQPHDSFPDAGEAITDSGPCREAFVHRHPVEPRVKLYSPREESFPFPQKYIDVSRTTHTNLDVKQEKRIDDKRNIDGIRRFVWLLDSFHTFTLLDEKAPDGYMWSGVAAYIQARSSMARAMEVNGKARQAEGEAKVV